MRQRLNKLIAQSGLCSRRKADELIGHRRVKLNGVVVTELGTLADPAQDTIIVDNKPLSTAEKPEYILLHKPTGYVTTTKHFPGEKNVLDLLPNLRCRVYPVGRLDKDTSGLLILTNDGALSYTLTHPKFTIDRVYEVTVRGKLSAATIKTIEAGGLAIEDYRTSPCSIKVLSHQPAATTVELTLHEGRKREIRKMFGLMKYPVLGLKRIQYGKLNLQGLKPGEWKHIKKAEII
jgi:pseudouridine synthase family